MHHRLDELRHRLIPLYTYDPAEEQEWEFSDREDEEDGLAVRTFYESFKPLIPFMDAHAAYGMIITSQRYSYL